jgi:hypothetical protein
VKSCSRTRAGVKAISFWTGAVTSHVASARMSSLSTNRSSSRRSRFSSRILSEYGRRAMLGNPAFSSAGRLKIRNVWPPAVNEARVLKEFCESIL